MGESNKRTAYSTRIKVLTNLSLYLINPDINEQVEVPKCAVSHIILLLHFGTKCASIKLTKCLILVFYF